MEKTLYHQGSKGLYILRETGEPTVEVKFSDPKMGSLQVGCLGGALLLSSPRFSGLLSNRSKRP